MRSPPSPAAAKRWDASRLPPHEAHVHLVEIKYCEDTRLEAQLEAAKRQHKDLISTIRRKYRHTTLHAILLGVGYLQVLHRRATVAAGTGPLGRRQARAPAAHTRCPVRFKNCSNAPRARVCCLCKQPSRPALIFIRTLLARVLRRRFRPSSCSLPLGGVYTRLREQS